jgi:hypothetical protein
MTWGMRSSVMDIGHPDEMAALRVKT